MKILYVFRSLAVWGGIEQILVDKMNYLSTKYNYDISILTTDQGSHAMPYQLDKSVQAEDLGIRFHQQYGYRWLRRLWEHVRLQRRFERRLRQRIATIRPDVIVCVATSHARSVIISAGQVPVVVESHSICLRTFGKQSPVQRVEGWLLRRCLKRAQAIVALTEGDATEWRKRYPQVRVIPNIVSLNTSTTSQQTSRRVIFIGRFDYQKRATEAIEIWRMVQPDFPEWTLDIYGEGEQQADVEQAARQQNLNICVHEPTPRIFDRYRESAFLISTSLFEPFGLVLPEAMSCGLPVVAYDCPYGPSTIIDEGRDGFLVEDGNRELFAERMRMLMADRELRLKMGQQAVISSGRYAPDHVMPQWKELFEELTR